MQCRVRILLNREVGVTTHEEPIQWTALAVGPTTSVDVLRVKHGVASDISLRLGNHSCEGLQVRSAIPSVGATEFAIRNLLGDQPASDDCSAERVPSEVVAGSSAWVKFGEIVHEAVHMNDRYASSGHFHASANFCGDGPHEERANGPINEERILVLALKFSLVLPWDAFWVGCELAEAVSYPRITLEILPQPVNVLNFHFWSGESGGSILKDFISLSADLPHLFVLFVIEDGLAELEVVSAIVLTWHLFVSLCLLIKSCECPLFVC